MLKWLIKFTVEIAPPVAATVIGAFVVHQLWPSDKKDVTPPATPPAAQVTTEAPKAASAPRLFGTKNADAPATSGEAPVTATASPASTGKSARQSSDVAKTASNPPSPPARESVFERAANAPLATFGAGYGVGVPGDRAAGDQHGRRRAHDAAADGSAARDRLPCIDRSAATAAPGG